MPAEATPDSGQVLVVDSCEDSREVLCTMLQRRGFPTLQANRAARGVELVRDHQPRLIVLDVESDSAEEETIREQYDAESRRIDARLLLIGRSTIYEQILPRDCVVAKPYHFAPLLRTIERLLGANPQVSCPILDSEDDPGR